MTIRTKSTILTSSARKFGRPRFSTASLGVPETWRITVCAQQLFPYTSVKENTTQAPFVWQLFFLWQDYTATIFLRQRWTDERLCFDGNKSLSLDGRLVEMLWVPDTFIVDSKKSFLHDVTVENRLIRIYPNGTVLYAIRYGNTPCQPLWLHLLTF